MYNSFVIQFDSGASEHWCCPCCSKRVRNGGKLQEYIPTFYSYKNANDKGWRHTKDIKYCHPDSTLGVWICPDCCKLFSVE